MFLPPTLFLIGVSEINLERGQSCGDHGATFVHMIIIQRHKAYFIVDAD